MTYFEHFSSF